MPSQPFNPPAGPELPATWPELGWSPAPEQQRCFQHLYEAVLLGNQRMNLTRVTAPQDFWEKHLWDSLRGIQPFLTQQDHPGPYCVIDIGTGAGFPGLPAAIAAPQWTVTLLDSTQKKVAFLGEAVQYLKLANAIPLAARAEAVGQRPQHRGCYDLALIRAVAPAAVCAEYALPLLKPGGSAVLYRGQWSSEETALLEPVVAQLGGKIWQIEQFTTPLSHGDRHCITLRKSAPTPDQFPREIGVPAKHPLLALAQT
ncbi:MAG: 16S rRNA (guanine(527)-N(7))-methyltransferase RsmG [Elainellaceae cyanobacterium]